MTAVTSRWAHVAAVHDPDGRVVVPSRPPLAFRVRPDTRRHVVEAEDTLASLAARYFAPLPRACGYWWALAEFQEPPLLDPLAPLVPGRDLLIPSLDLLGAYLEGTA